MVTRSSLCSGGLSAGRASHATPAAGAERYPGLTHQHGVTSRDSSLGPPRSGSEWCLAASNQYTGGSLVLLASTSQVDRTLRPLGGMYPPTVTLQPPAPPAGNTASGTAGDRRISLLLESAIHPQLSCLNFSTFHPSPAPSHPFARPSPPLPAYVTRALSVRSLFFYSRRW